MDVFTNMGTDQQHGLGMGHIIVLTCTGRDVPHCLEVGQGSRAHTLEEGGFTGVIFRAHINENFSEVFSRCAVIKIGQGMGAIFLLDLCHVVGDFIQGFVP